MKLTLATNNNDKITEMKRLLADLPITVLSKSDFPEFPDVEETEETLAGNARLKARACAAALGTATLADDTGLEVDALGGAPGVYSARYSGPNATYESNCRKLIAELGELPEEKRTARFRCVIVIDWVDRVDEVDGVLEGFITTEPHGTGGFGYDPVFYYPPAGKTLAEMTLDEKNAISHRGQALRKARDVIAAHLAAANSD